MLSHMIQAEKKRKAAQRSGHPDLQLDPPLRRSSGKCRRGKPIEDGDFQLPMRRGNPIRAIRSPCRPKDVGDGCG